MISIGTVLLVISLILNWLSQRIIGEYAHSAQMNFMLGFGGIQGANELLKQGDLASASRSAGQGVASLRASSAGMSKQGVHGVAGLSMFFDEAMSGLLNLQPQNKTPASDSQKENYRDVIQVAVDEFWKITRKNDVGTISTQQFQSLIDKVYQAMTAEERARYQGSGP